MVVFTFLLQKFEKVAGTIIQIIICQSMNAVWAVSIIISGGDTQTLIAEIKFVWTFCTNRCGDVKTSCTHPAMPSHQVMPSHLLTPACARMRPNESPGETFTASHFALFTSWQLIHLWHLGQTSSTFNSNYRHQYTYKKKKKSSIFLFNIFLISRLFFVFLNL